MDERAEKYPDTPAGEALPVETQVSVITDIVGEGKGTKLKGFGRCMRREPKKRGGCSRADVDALVEERLDERVSQVKDDLKKEVRAEVIEEVREELRKEMDERMNARMEEMMRNMMENRQLEKGTPSNASPSNP